MLECFFTNCLEDLNVRAREKYPSIYEKWCRLDQSLATLRSDPKGHSYFNLDASWDIVLRCIEDEQQSFVQASGRYRGASTLHLQIGLSKGWLLSVYELLRASTAQGRCGQKPPSKEYCMRPQCFNCQVLRVKRELAHFRMPLAKFEPALIKAPNYHSVLMFENDGGSVGWRTDGYTSKINGVDKISRRELSDFVLDNLASAGEP